MSGLASRMVEDMVRGTTFFQKLCEKIYDEKLDQAGKGQVPMLKVTLAMPLMFQKFQTKLFSKLGVNIGCPNYRQTVKMLLERDKNKDRLISRAEFEDVAICMLHFAAGNFYESFKQLYGIPMLLGVILMQMLTLVLVVNCGGTIQWALNLIPTFGGLVMPSFLLMLPSLLLGPILGVGFAFLLLVQQEVQPVGVPVDEMDRSLGPKGSEILRGFVELRKGIFKEKRDKIRAFFSGGPVSSADAEPLYCALAAGGEKSGLNDDLLDTIGGSALGDSDMSGGLAMGGRDASIISLKQRIVAKLVPPSDKPTDGLTAQQAAPVSSTSKGFGILTGPIAQMVHSKLQQGASKVDNGGIWANDLTHMEHAAAAVHASGADPAELAQDNKRFFGGLVKKVREKRAE